MSKPVNVSQKEIFHVAGDVADPAGSRMRGTAPGYLFTRTALGHPVLFYQMPGGVEVVLVADVYKLEGEPAYIHIICPLCAAAGRKDAALRIVEGDKEMLYEPEQKVMPPASWSPADVASSFPDGLGGRLSVSAFGCSWELSEQMRSSFPGMAVCPWRVVIDNNIVRDV